MATLLPDACCPFSNTSSCRARAVGHALHITHEQLVALSAVFNSIKNGNTRGDEVFNLKAIRAGGDEVIRPKGEQNGVDIDAS